MTGQTIEKKLRFGVGGKLYTALCVKYMFGGMLPANLTLQETCFLLNIS